MVAWWRGQSEYGVFLIIDRLDHEQTFYHALHPIEFEVIDPFLPGVLLWTIFLGQPKTLTKEIGVIIHIQFYMLVMGKGEREDTVTLHLLYLR
ncbi:hypothetical protein [uncultured Muribaculum sp.]|uniref:hypothetical protein n=1 Tax=uncultured Muribaculum sp. TaxID=1918613 RepID=UPI00265CFADB|nr:hypothetical protein [uncultured Muribaculum sp.]